MKPPLFKAVTHQKKEIFRKENRHSAGGCFHKFLIDFTGLYVNEKWHP